MATDAITYKIEGLAELEKQLLKLEKKVAEKELRAALTKAAVPVVKRAKAYAAGSSDTGALRQAIGRRIRKGRYKNVASVFVGVIANNKKALALARTKRKINGIWYGHIVEIGYGRQRAQPFMRPALDDEANKSTAIFRDELKLRLESVARK